jgi:hypothetical protein
MATIQNDFDSYFNSIQTSAKVGDLDNAAVKLISVAEYKSTKSGKTSLKITFDHEGAEFGTYMGLSTDKAIDITNNRLLKILTASVGAEEAIKTFKAVFEDEDNEHETRQIAMDFATKVNKKLKKKPVDAIVTRHKSEDGLWEVKWKLPSDDEEKSESSAEAPKTEDSGDFLDSLK